MAEEVNGEKIVETFRKFDLNGDGIISRPELRRVLCSLSADFDDSTVERLLAGADKNRDGRIQYKEFVDWVMQAGGDGDGDKAAINWRGFMPERLHADISQRYNLDKATLGEGGYGQVFIARDEKTGRSVCVKKVTKTSDAKRTEAFYTEIKIMKELDHPNICRLLEVYEVRSHIFLVMEHCEGKEVFNRIIETRGISEAVTADIVGQVTAALRYAHGRQIAHRDIKPENIIFLTSDKSDTRVKLIDWGLSICFDGAVMRTAVGSKTYAAPEVMSSRNQKAYTEACDIWSLGVLTYVMMAGKPPFWGTDHQHLAAARAERYPMSGAPWPAISDEGKRFIRMLLRADPKNRPPVAEVSAHPWLSKKDFVEDLESQSEVLGNIRKFTNTGTFTALCISAVARQLDHRHLKDIHQVFRDMDNNGDGYLCVDEVKAGLRKIHGEDSAEYNAIEETFRGLDLDGSGIVDYTEFCAAGMGQHVTKQEDAIWAAFKAFDFDNTGNLGMEELKAVLANADVKKVWTAAVCDKVSAKVMEKWDKDGDGSISFDEYMLLMRQSFDERVEGDKDEIAEAIGNPQANTEWVYDMLQQVTKLDTAIEEVPQLRRTEKGECLSG